MAQPTAYNQATDFSDEEVNGVAGRSTVRTPALDAEFSALETTIAQIRANLAALQRDDLELIDGAVKLHTLSAEVLLLLSSSSFTVNDPIAWVTAKEYAALSLVKEGTGTYVCVVTHTSGVFATDLAAGKWLVIFDSSSYVSSAIAFTPTGGVAATNVQAAIAEVDSEALKKAQNLADVASVTTARSNLSVPSKAEIQNQAFVYFADTGTADAMVATPIPAWTAYATGQRVSVKKAGVANATTTTTLNVSALGAKVIFKRGGLALLVGDMAANGHYDLQYDAAYNGAAGGWELLNPIGLNRIALDTPIATTSGQAHSFIAPAGTRRVTISFSGVSLDGNDNLLVQIGPAGGPETTGYVGSSVLLVHGSTGAVASSTSGFVMALVDATKALSGHMELLLHDPATNAWTARHTVNRPGTSLIMGAGNKSIAGELVNIRITTATTPNPGVTDNFDAGSVNVACER